MLQPPWAVSTQSRACTLGTAWALEHPLPLPLGDLSGPFPQARCWDGDAVIPSLARACGDTAAGPVRGECEDQGGLWASLGLGIP